MYNSYGNHVAYAEYSHAMRQVQMPVLAPLSLANLTPPGDIWPNEYAPVFRRLDNGLEIAQLQWGFEAANPRRRPVIKFRSDRHSLPKSRRCLVPASHFFEFRGNKAPKQRWKFTLHGEPWFCFAGVWHEASDTAPETFALLTAEPGPDVAPITSRHLVVLTRGDWRAWLDLTKPEAKMLVPLPTGSLDAERVH